ncbi:hypothetical protein LZ31DRAFT_590607 [Colletotrichum somersetense]|nr:hypothetical protein LZ31DRAFT_590607 [Colletotrichum somersetense]
MATICIHLKTNMICDRNKILACDPDLFQRTSKVDNIYWSPDNAAQLCTTTCIDSSRQCEKDAAGSSEGEFLRSGDCLVEADTISTRFPEALKITCLRFSAESGASSSSRSEFDSDVAPPDCAENPSDP